MTFRKERYPENWPELRASILERAHHGCECTGQCGHEHPGGRCFATHGDVILRGKGPHERHLWRQHTHGGVCTGEDCGAVQVVLTVAHLDHVEANNDPENLRAMCQFCHLALDREDNARRCSDGRARALAALGQGLLPWMEVSRG
jgi:hypothetical protein